MQKNARSLNQRVGVLLMTYGSPKSSDDVYAYLKKVYGGKEPKQKTVKEFRRRYKLIGGSPLIHITQNQANELEKELKRQYPSGPGFRVTAGMRFSPPFIKEVVSAIGSDSDLLVGIIMSPQYSPIIMQGYIKELNEAVTEVSQPSPDLIYANDWHLHPLFVQALAQRVREALDLMPEKVKQTVPVLFSAHSMPKRVIDKEPNYIKALQETGAAVAKAIGLKRNRWMFCYQSAGHTPEEWLKPDFSDIMPLLKQEGHTHVLIAPVQFLSDHLEILYDVDIGAREQAEKYGIIFARTESLNTSPLFIKALAAIVSEAVAKSSR